MVLNNCAFPISWDAESTGGTVQWGSLRWHATLPCALSDPKEQGLHNSEGEFPYFFEKWVLTNGQYFRWGRVAVEVTGSVGARGQDDPGLNSKVTSEVSYHSRSAGCDTILYLIETFSSIKQDNKNPLYWVSG